MARMKASLDGLIEDFRKRLSVVIEEARDTGRADAMAEIQRAVGGRMNRAMGKRRSGRPAKAKMRKSGKKRKNPWAGLSPEKKLERVNAIRKGRGLPPKDKA